MRFIIQRESGSDWCVIDTKRNATIASGLFEDEAEQRAAMENEQFERDKDNYV
jgi:hypothetical protein